MDVADNLLRLLAATALALPLVHAQTIVPPGTLSGVIIDGSTGHGIAGARVRLQSGEDDALFATADSDGHFQFAGLDIKTYQATATYPGFLTSNAQRIQFGTYHTNAELRVELHRYAVLTGIVTDPAGVPAAGVAVAILQRFPSTERGHSSCGLGSRDGDFMYTGRTCTRTNDLGEYRLAPIPAGSYYVAADPNPMPLVNSQITSRRAHDPTERTTYYAHALKPSEVKPIALAEGKEMRADIQIARQGGVTVTGRVLGLGAGQSATVTVAPLSAGGISWTDSTPSGHFEVTNLPPGKYTFQASATNENGQPNLHALAFTRQTVEVGTSQLDGVDLRLAPTLNLEGLVVFSPGCPMVPVGIILGGDYVYNIHSGADGSFTLANLIPGKYIARIRPETASSARLSAARLGDTEISLDSFEVTQGTKGPLRIDMSCGTR